MSPSGWRTADSSFGSAMRRKRWPPQWGQCGNAAGLICSDVVGPQPPRLLDQLRRCAQAAGHSATTIETFALWVRNYIVFHAKRHPRELGVGDIGRFLADVAAKDKNPLEALAAARGALDFLYRGSLACDS